MYSLHDPANVHYYKKVEIPALKTWIFFQRKKSWRRIERRDNCSDECKGVNEEGWEDVSCQWLLQLLEVEERSAWLHHQVINRSVVNWPQVREKWGDMFTMVKASEVFPMRTPVKVLHYTSVLGSGVLSYYKAAETKYLHYRVRRVRWHLVKHVLCHKACNGRMLNNQWSKIYFSTLIRWCYGNPCRKLGCCSKCPARFAFFWEDKYL